MTAMMLMLVLAAPTPVPPPGALAGVPRLGTRIAIEQVGHLRSTLQATDAAAPGLVVLARSPAMVGGAGVRMELIVTNGSGAMAYHLGVRLQGADGRPLATVAVPADARGLAPGESSSPLAINCPVDPASVFPVEVRAVPFTAVTVVSELGGYGREPGHLSKPRGVAIAGNGDIVVADRGNNRVEVLGPDGKFRREWGQLGQGPADFDHPEDVDVDRVHGRAYVCDMNNTRVQVFTMEGALVATLPAPGAVELNHPSDLALAPDGGSVYVIDSGNMRVVQLDNSGRLLRTWGTWGEAAGQFRAPLDIETDAAGRVYVSDGANRNVQVFGAEGLLLATLTGTRASPFRYPTAVLPFGTDRVLVADFAEDRIRAFTLDGRQLGEFGRPGAGAGAMHYPADLDIEGNLLFVSQTAIDSITVFDIGAWEPFSSVRVEMKP